MITLDNIERIMVQYGFDEGLIKEIIEVFQKKMKEDGEKAFQVWFNNLNYSPPEEFRNEDVASRISVNGLIRRFPSLKKRPAYLEVKKPESPNWSSDIA